jgi:hypothetical protein
VAGLSRAARSTAQALKRALELLVAARPALAAGLSGVRGLLAALIGALATAVGYAAVLGALVLALHVVFVLLDANPGNPIVVFVRRVAGRLVWDFQALFTPPDAKQQIAVNEGVAAVAYLVAGAVAVRVLRRLGALTR